MTKVRNDRHPITNDNQARHKYMEARAPAFKAYTLLEGIFPHLPPPQLRTLIQDADNPQQDWESVVDTLADILTTENDGLIQNLHNMYRAGFAFEHMLIYANAPTEPSPQTTTKRQLLEKWNASNQFKTRSSFHETFDRAMLAGPALVTLATVPLIFVGVGAGHITDNPTLLETSLEMGKLIGEYIEDFGGDPISKATESLSGISWNNMLGLGVAGLVLAKTHSKLRADIEKSKQTQIWQQIEASDTDMMKQKQAYDELSRIAQPLQHLFSHLTPNEVVTFLCANDQTREKMLRVCPPSIEQRYLYVLADGGRLTHQWQKRLEVAISGWDTNLPLAITRATLKEGIARMREATETTPSSATAFAP